MATVIGVQNSPVETRDINHAWARYNVIVPPGEMARAIRSLIARDVIAGQGKLVFTVDLLRMWVQKYRRLEWVKEEITDSILQWTSEHHQVIPRRAVLTRFVLPGLAGTITIGGIIWLTRSSWLQAFSLHSTPTPTNSGPTSIKTTLPAPTPSQPGLEQRRYRLDLTVDDQGLLSNSENAVNNLKSQVLARTFLKGRRVGFVIVYAGAPDIASIETAVATSKKVMTVLKTINQEGFNSASYYDPLFTLGESSNIVHIDLFLYIQ